MQADAALWSCVAGMLAVDVGKDSEDLLFFAGGLLIGVGVPFRSSMMTSLFPSFAWGLITCIARC